MEKIIVQTVVKNHPRIVYVISDFIGVLLYFVVASRRDDWYFPVALPFP